MTTQSSDREVRFLEAKVRMTNAYWFLKQTFLKSNSREMIEKAFEVQREASDTYYSIKYPNFNFQLN